MPKKSEKPKYASEAEMCAQFIGYAETQGWVAYAETAGWDILLVRKSDGYQCGIQAKLRANLDVVMQAVDREMWRDGPDFRAVLVPAYLGQVGQLQGLCPYLSTTVISARGPGIVDRHGMIATGYGRSWAFRPDLPPRSYLGIGRDWHELCPAHRHRLPEYVPDVPAGAPAPIRLTDWKVGAIKIAVLLERRRFVTRADFKHIGIDHRRWIAAGPASYLVADPPHGFKQRDGSKPGMGYKAEHPRNYDEIAADFDRWAPPAQPEPVTQARLIA